jgi:hypothetical protein
MSMELAILTPEENFLKSVEFNFQELKTELTNRLEKYKNVVYTEDQTKEAKADKANLNRLKTAFEDKRKEVKAKCLEPYDSFELKMKELTALIEKPILQIDSGIKKFEEKQKTEKKDTLKGFYAEYIGNLKDLVPFEKLFNEKMLNATVKVADSQKAILSQIEQINRDLVVITELKSAFELQVKDFYLRAFDLSGALSEGKRLEEQKKKQDEYEAKRQAEPIMVAKPVFIPPPEAVTTPEEKKEAVAVMVETPQIETVDFRVHATMEQFLSLKQFLLNNQIKFERI